jgi:predicted small secreted protein
MRRRSIAVVCVAAALVLTPALAGCNTVRGFGQDIQGLGRTTSKAATSTQEAITPSSSREDEEEE